MLNNPFGVLLYLILRNDISWGLLSEEERRSILEANKKHNTGRDDYINPEKYGANRCTGGKNWNSFAKHGDDHRVLVLLRILDENKPRKVLEVGPGAGFYTRAICEYPTVENYAAIDVGQAFLDYLRPYLEAISRQRRFTYSLIQGEATQVCLPDKYDLIVLFSTVHHIPNRVDLFRGLASMLSEKGIVFCFDPSHYIYRILRLMKKCVTAGYLKKDFYLNKDNLSTHHMCSYGEYRKIVGSIPSLKIERVLYKLPGKVKKYDWLFVPNRWFSTEIGIIIRKS
jgi:SAM-dependent methyltransferase